MDKQETKKIYDKFKEKTEKEKLRAEKDILKNTGIPILFGDDEIYIKQLLWDDANKFEDKIIELVGSISGMSLDTENLDIPSLLTTIIKSLLRDGLLDLAGLATEGKINLKYIKAVKATKDDVINIVVEAILLNYSYLKNLITLVKKFK